MVFFRGLVVFIRPDFREKPSVQIGALVDLRIREPLFINHAEKGMGKRLFGAKKFIGNGTGRREGQVMDQCFAGPFFPAASPLCRCFICKDVKA